MQSRAAVVLNVVVLILAAIHERKSFAPWKIIAMTVGSMILYLLFVICYLLFVLWQQDRDSEGISHTDQSTPRVKVDQTMEKLSSSAEGSTLIAPLTNLGLEKLAGTSDMGDGTRGARLETYGQVWDFLHDEGFWFAGAGQGTDIL